MRMNVCVCVCVCVRVCVCVCAGAHPDMFKTWQLGNGGGWGVKGGKDSDDGGSPLMRYVHSSMYI